MPQRLIRKSTRLAKNQLLPPEHRTENKKLAVSVLFIDPGVQREIKPGHLKMLTANWRNSMCGPLDVSARRQKNGRYRYSIMDGYHRFTAGQSNGVKSFDCVIHYDLTIEDEASFHLWEQTHRKADSAVDGWKLKIAAGSDVHVEAAKVLADRGLTVGSPGRESIACAGALDVLVTTYGPDVLAATLDAIEAAYGRKKEAWIKNLVGGFGEVLGTQPGVADPVALGRKVAKQYPSPDSLVQAGRAEQRAMASGGGGAGLVALVAMLIAKSWNSRRRGTRYEFAPVRLVSRDEILGMDEDADEDEDED
jgi:hypothetical protein